MSTFKPGQRFRSCVCATEVMIIKYVGAAEISCGGARMASAGEDVKPGKANPGFMTGTEVGKRYINDDGSIELLCTKAGAGSLAAGGVALAVKKAKPLPSSD